MINLSKVVFDKAVKASTDICAEPLAATNFLPLKRAYPCIVVIVTWFACPCARVSLSTEIGCLKQLLRQACTHWFCAHETAEQRWHTISGRYGFKLIAPKDRPV